MTEPASPSRGGWLPVAAALAATAAIAAWSVRPGDPVPGGARSSPLEREAREPSSPRFASLDDPRPADASPAATLAPRSSADAPADAGEAFATDPYGVALASADDAALVGDLEGARAELERALALLRAADPDDPRIADTLDRMGQLEVRFGQTDAALDRYADALAERERRLGPDHPDLAITLDGMAQALLADPNRRGESVEVAERALRLREQALGPEHPDLLPSLTLLARAKRVAGGGIHMGDAERAEVEELYRRAVTVGESLHGEGAPQLAAPMRDLAGYLAAERRFGEAATVAAEAVEALERDPERDPQQLGSSLGFLGHVYERDGDDQRAEEAYLRSVEVVEESLGEVAASGQRVRLARFYAGSGRSAEAEAQYEQAIGAMSASQGSDSTALAGPLANLAEIQRRQGDLDAAEASYRRAIEISEGSGGTALTYNLRLSVDGLAQILRSTDRAEEAARFEAYSAEILEQQRGGTP